MVLAYLLTLVASVVYPFVGLADGCEHVYLDCGSNIGVQVRKLFEPAEYPKAPVINVFATHFGTAGPDRNRKVCAFGFEPNPRLEQRLRNTQAAYNALGWRTHFFTQTALSTYDGSAILHADNANRRSHADGSSISHDKLPAMNETFNVSTINMATFLQTVDERILLGLPRGKVVAKLDVEGEEFELIPLMIRTRTLCIVDVWFIEYHDRFFKDKSVARNVKETLRRFVENATNACKSQIVEMDDETYNKAQSSPGLPIRQQSRLPYRRT